MKKLILGSSIAILTILVISLITCICVIFNLNKKISDLESAETNIVYVEVPISESETPKEDKKIYYGDDKGNVYEFIGRAFNKNNVSTIFVQDIVTKGVRFEVEYTFLRDHHILEDYEP